MCQDTFSRSDILKRHFQKCSQRRGNPTGASHLAYSQNHLKRQAAKAKQQQQQQQHVSPQDSQIPPTTTDPDLPVVTQATINNDAATIFADSSVGMGTINAIQHHLANISTKNYGNDIHDSTSGTLTSPALNRPNHNFLSGQPGPASLPSSGSSTPLTAKTMSGQFPHTFQSDSTNRASFAEPTIRNHQPPQGTQFDGNGFEWSPPFASGKDNQERASSINQTSDQNINVQE